MIARAYILAGGQSRRFGFDKARVFRNGVPNIQLLSQNLITAGLAVTAIAQQTRQYEDLGIPTIADRIRDGGPLIGILTALMDEKTRCSEGWVLILTCDTFQSSTDWIALLSGAVTASSSVVLFQDDRLQPFPGLYHTRLMEEFAAVVEKPERSVHHWLEGMMDAIQFVTCPQHLRPQQFNTLDEFVALIQGT